MRQVQLNLVKDKLTNDKGEKFIYRGLYNSISDLYFVFNSERPNHLLALTDKDVENVNFDISDDQLLLGQAYAYVELFGVSTIQLKRARLCKNEYEDRAIDLVNNEDYKCLADVVRGFVELDKDTIQYEKALSDLPALNYILSRVNVEFKEFVKVSSKLPSRFNYLMV